MLHILNELGCAAKIQLLSACNVTIQGKRAALVSQPPHQADDHRRNSDAGSEKAAVQQLTSFLVAAPQLPSPLQPQPPLQPQQATQQQAPQPHQQPQQQPIADGQPLPPVQRRPSARQLVLPPPATGATAF